MTGKIIYVPVEPHPCELPPPTYHRQGTRWQCECNQIWALSVKEDGAKRWLQWDNPGRQLTSTRTMPQPDPDFEDPGMPEKTDRPWWKGVARHSNGKPDVDVFIDNIRTVRTTGDLLKEDADAKKTAIGLITIVIVTVLICVTVFALTGNLG